MDERGQLQRERVFSGVQPSGELHLGNYLGALGQWVRLQERYDCIFCVVDLHALTVRPDPVQLRKATRHVAAAFLACGIDPGRSIVFVQSQAPQHTELAWVMLCLASYGELGRMTQFKEKARGRREEAVGAGLYAYPALMAADILLYDTRYVPVGEDQRQHLELARDLAQRFNTLYGETFVVPEAIIPEETGRIMSLEDPTKKMSKTAGGPGSYIALRDPPDVIRRKVRRAVTDSGTEVYAAPDKPAITNLLRIFSGVSGRPIPELETEYRHTGYARFKADLAEAVVARLAPIQERLAELEAHPQHLDAVLEEGAHRARVLAEAKMLLVRGRVGLAAGVAASAREERTGPRHL